MCTQIIILLSLRNVYCSLIAQARIEQFQICGKLIVNGINAVHLFVESTDSTDS